jgi:hypothetical protein
VDAPVVVADSVIVGAVGDGLMPDLRQVGGQRVGVGGGADVDVLAGR